MGTRLLAALLVFSWIIFSAIDLIEDFSFGNATVESAESKNRGPAKPIKVANDTVERANRYPGVFAKLPEHSVLQTGAQQAFVNADMIPKASRCHLSCVLLI
ncbi:MAG: hypothetical protein ACREQ7_19420 [Candidatus Binatia bacterium]